MTGGEWKTPQILDVKFRLLSEDLARKVGATGQDANVVLKTDRSQLQVQLMLNPKKPTWRVFELTAAQLLGEVEPEEWAETIFNTWRQEARSSR